jgi:hypothetical protein
LHTALDPGVALILNEITEFLSFVRIVWVLRVVRISHVSEGPDFNLDVTTI